MSYIIAVNPAILSNTGMPIGALVTATCLTAAFSTILMGLYTNTPLALASGMSLNAFFAFSVVIGMNIPWQVALAAVFIEGLIFILLSFFKSKGANYKLYSDKFKIFYFGWNRAFYCFYWLCQRGNYH